MEDILNQFHYILKSPETQQKMKKKFNVKDIIKFKRYIYDMIDKHEQQKFIKNKNSKKFDNLTKINSFCKGYLN